MRRHRKVSTNKPAFWLIRSDRYGSTLGRDGRFWNMKDPNEFKTYKTEGWATRKLRRLNGEFTAVAVYLGEVVDCCGRIFDEKGRMR